MRPEYLDQHIDIPRGAHDILVEVAQVSDLAIMVVEGHRFLKGNLVISYRSVNHSSFIQHKKCSAAVLECEKVRIGLLGWHHQVKDYQGRFTHFRDERKCFVSAKLAEVRNLAVSTGTDFANTQKRYSFC